MAIVWAVPIHAIPVLLNYVPFYFVYCYVNAHAVQNVKYLALSISNTCDIQDGIRRLHKGTTNNTTVRLKLWLYFMKRAWVVANFLACYIETGTISRRPGSGRCSYCGRTNEERRWNYYISASSSFVCKRLQALLETHNSTWGVEKC